MQINFGTAGSVQAVTKSDTTPINCRALYIGGAGDVVVKTNKDATAQTFTGVLACTVLPVAIDGGMVMNATTATAILALA